MLSGEVGRERGFSCSAIVRANACAVFSWSIDDDPATAWRVQAGRLPCSRHALIISCQSSFVAACCCASSIRPPIASAMTSTGWPRPRGTAITPVARRHMRKRLAATSTIRAVSCPSIGWNPGPGSSQLLRSTPIRAYSAVVRETFKVVRTAVGHRRSEVRDRYCVGHNVCCRRRSHRMRWKPQRCAEWCAMVVSTSSKHRECHAVRSLPRARDVEFSEVLRPVRERSAESMSRLWGPEFRHSKVLQRMRPGAG